MASTSQPECETKSASSLAMTARLRLREIWSYGTQRWSIPQVTKLAPHSRIRSARMNADEAGLRTCQLAMAAKKYRLSATTPATKQPIT